MVYHYDCCGDQVQTVDMMMTCPNCGRNDTYNFIESVGIGRDRHHGRVHSIQGLRNYYDESMDSWVGDNKKEVMRRKNMVYASNAEAWDG